MGYRRMLLLSECFCPPSFCRTCGVALGGCRRTTIRSSCGFLMSRPAVTVEQGKKMNGKKMGLCTSRGMFGGLRMNSAKSVQETSVSRKLKGRKRSFTEAFMRSAIDRIFNNGYMFLWPLDWRLITLLVPPRCRSRHERDPPAIFALHLRLHRKLVIRFELVGITKRCRLSFLEEVRTLSFERQFCFIFVE
ncbi:hypothetical protein Rcae01_00683 [Novipirellula caenicola]|uniref:Secreted protein n=1 Tax=Novipirellula caenicola TaxID=1536901 RepID=A0ABP9VKC1_9BACT